VDRSALSYDPYLSTHVFTKVNIDAPKPKDNIWIGVSHIFLPTFWCANAIAGRATMTKYTTNAFDGKYERCTSGKKSWTMKEKPTKPLRTSSKTGQAVQSK
jgi:hypothetical protein